MTTVTVTEFQTDIALPSAARGRHNGPGLKDRFPFATMPVGASFFIAGASQKIINTVLRCAKANDMKASSRLIVEGGLRGARFWRVA